MVGPLVPDPANPFSPLFRLTIRGKIPTLRSIARRFTPLQRSNQPVGGGGQAPRFSLRLDSTRGDVDEQPLKQAAYRVRVVAGQDMDTAAEL